MNEKVILIHGLVRTPRSMKKLAMALQNVGYTVENCHYKSTQFRITETAEKTISQALHKLDKTGKVHFITHSLGGILLRDYLHRHRIPNLGRVVMLSPPNQGSQVAEWLRPFSLFRKVFGPAGMQLGTGAASLPRQLGPANFDLGIIAGTKGLNPLFSPFLSGPDDGTLSVEETKLEGMHDHICLPASHPFIMNNSKVISQVIFFLQHGQFNHPGNHP